MATKRKAKGSKKEDLKALVVDYFNEHGKGSYNYKQVALDLGITRRESQYMVADILDDLTLDGFLVELVPGKYQASEITTTSEGVFVRRSNGKNSVIIDNSEVPIFVAERNSMHALNGDRVRVHLCAQRKGVEPEAQVVEILEKKDQVFIGTLKVDKNFAFLQTDSKYLASDIFIPKGKLKGGQTGDKAIARIVEWNDDDKNPTGELIDILGKAGDNNSEMNAILAEFGLPYVYPKNAPLQYILSTVLSRCCRNVCATASARCARMKRNWRSPASLKWTMLPTCMPIASAVRSSRATAVSPTKRLRP